MSEVDTDDLTEHGWFDSESELPGISLVDPTIELMQEAGALKTGNSSAMCPAPYKGTLVGNGSQEGAESS